MIALLDNWRKPVYLTRRWWEEMCADNWKCQSFRGVKASWWTKLSVHSFCVFRLVSTFWTVFWTNHCITSLHSTSAISSPGFGPSSSNMSPWPTKSRQVRADFHSTEILIVRSWGEDHSAQGRCLTKTWNIDEHCRISTDHVFHISHLEISSTRFNVDVFWCGHYFSLFKQCTSRRAFPADGLDTVCTFRCS